MRDVVGRTAFITGGASGIGLGMVMVFARAGMNVFAVDVREDHLAEARAAVEREDFADQVRFALLDVTDRAGWPAAVDAAEAEFGPVHVLCNNAGIGLLKSLGSADYGDWDWAIGVNVTSMFNGIHTVLPRMREHGDGGHIVNTASMAGILQYSGAGIYVATKFAVVGLSEALRAELAGEGIGVSVFCPGGVRTNIRDYEKARPAQFAGGAPVVSGPRPGAAFSEEDRARLASLTASPEEAAELVLQGIRDNALYIFTAPEFRSGVEERHTAILRALGEDKAREATALELIPSLVGSPIYRES